MRRAAGAPVHTILPMATTTTQCRGHCKCKCLQKHQKQNNIPAMQLRAAEAYNTF